MRTISRLAVTVVSLGAVTGCSVYKDMTTSEFAKQDADAIVVSASKAMQDVTSMRLTGDVRSDGTQYFVDLRVGRTDDCIGSIRYGSSNVDIRRVGDKAWVKGESGALNRLTGNTIPHQVLKQLSVKWLLVEKKDVKDLCDFDQLLETFEVVDFAGEAETAEGTGKNTGKDKGKTDEFAGEVPTTILEEATMDGAKVVKIGGSPGGTHEEHVWVLSSSPHYVVKIESTEAKDGGTLSFSDFNADVEVEAPEPKDVLAG